MVILVAISNRVRWSSKGFGWNCQVCGCCAQEADAADRGVKA